MMGLSRFDFAFVAEVLVRLVVALTLPIARSVNGTT
jgi:hypothetical protein